MFSYKHAIRQTAKQTDGQTDRQAECRQRETETDRQTNRQTDTFLHTYKQPDCKAGGKTDRQTEFDRQTDRHNTCYMFSQKLVKLSVCDSSHLDVQEHRHQSQHKKSPYGHGERRVSENYE